MRKAGGILCWVKKVKGAVGGVNFGRMILAGRMNFQCLNEEIISVCLRMNFCELHVFLCEQLKCKQPGWKLENLLNNYPAL